MLRRVAVNFGSLLSVQFAANLASLATVPFLARVLGLEAWGLLVMAQSFRMVCWPIVEYGFVYSGTRAIAAAPDAEARAEITGRILAATVTLGILVAVLGVFAGGSLPLLKGEWAILGFATLAAFATGSAPWWYFQGVNRLPEPARVSVFSKGLAVLAIFAFIRMPTDVWKVVAIDAGASLLVAAWMWGKICRDLGIPRPEIRGALSALRDAGPLAHARIAERWYDAVPSLVAGAFLGAAAAGLYGGADKLLKVWRTAANAFARGAVPVAVTSARKFRRRVVVVMAIGLGSVAALVLALGAPPIVRLLLGPGFEGAVRLLQTLTLGMPATLGAFALVGIVSVPRGLDREIRDASLIALVLLSASASGGASLGGLAGLAGAAVAVEWVRCVLLAASSHES